MDIVQRGGRKKDFWNLHELLDDYSVNDMIELHKKRFEWTHDEKMIRKNFTNFLIADNDFDPICLKGKIWEFVKEDLTEAVDSNNHKQAVQTTQKSPLYMIQRAAQNSIFCYGLKVNPI